MSFKINGDSKFCDGDSYRIVAVDRSVGSTSPTRPTPTPSVAPTPAPTPVPNTAADRRDRMRAEAVAKSREEAIAREKQEAIESTYPLPVQPTSTPTTRTRTPTPTAKPTFMEWFLSLFQFGRHPQSTRSTTESVSPRQFRTRHEPRPRPSRQRTPATRHGLTKTQMIEVAPPRTKPTRLGLPKSRDRMGVIIPKIPPITLTGLTKLFKD